MLSIMRRSGFITEDQFESLQQHGGDGNNNNQQSQQQQRSSSKKKGPSASGSRQPRKTSIAGAQSQQQQTPRRGVLKQQDSKRSPQRSQEEIEAEANAQSDGGEAGFPLVERSISMPAIGGSLMESSDEQGGPSGAGPTGQVTAEAEGPAEVISDEVIQELGMWEQVIQEEKKKTGEDQTTDNKNEETKTEAQQQQQQQQQTSPRRMSVVPPTVNIQESTPVNMSAQSTVRFDENVETVEASKSVSITKENFTDDGKYDEKVKEPETGNDKNQPIASSVTPPNDPQQQQQQRRQSKVGPPPPSQLPQARRLSRVPQQLYIKTTPAIPMNANIQHILSNVARTEGPFQFPGEAVKPAVIALHDHAWFVSCI